VLSFLTPVWLLGLGAIVVPIALHLWHRRGGRPVRIGSIRLLVGAPPATRASWRLQDPWLLLVRCAVLALLAAALAHPWWTPRTPAAESVQAFVSADALGATGLMDSLRREGVATRPLAGPDYWTALRDADRTGPRGRRFVVFAPPLLRHFSGERPVLRAPIDWRARPAVGGTGEPTGLAATPMAARIVAVYADLDRQEDAHYVSAAVRAAAAATGIPAVLTLRSTGSPSVVDGADWLIWLSSRSLPDALLAAVRRGATVLQDDATGDERHDSTTILLATGSSDALLFRHDGGRTPDLHAPLWRAGTGLPLLTAAREGRGLRLHFHSRFHPAWSDLVLRPEFPVALAALWIAPLEALPARDDRPISVRQLLPARDTTPHHPSRGEDGRPLFMPTWILAVLLFAAERWVSGRPRASGVGS